MGAPPCQVRPQLFERRPTTYDFECRSSAEIAKHDPSALQFSVITAPAVAIDTEAACVQVPPASDVERNVPSRCEGERGEEPVTLNRQCVAFAQVNRLACRPVIGAPVGVGIADDFQCAPPSEVNMNWAS